MNFHVLTLFPEMIAGGVNTSITGRAIENGKIAVHAVNIRDYTTDKHNKVDDYPYGGGAGMLMQAEPVYQAWCAVRDSLPGNEMERKHPRTVYVTPQGQTFHQRMAEEFAKEEDLVILCGHYEGIDERVLEEVVTDYVSIGDYVLTGGELAAMVMVDAISRLVPGVLNNDSSAETESFHGNLLEYPQYSRPEVWNGKKVPEVLLSGNQKKIDAWRKEAAIARTKERRPDLYHQYDRLQQCLGVLQREKLLHIDMIELINRGRALLRYQSGDEMVLEDTVTGILYHTMMGMDLKQSALTGEEWPWLGEARYLVLHQKEAASYVKAQYGYVQPCDCLYAVYTKREKLSVSGLYRPDGQPMDNGLVIRPLTVMQVEQVSKLYREWADTEYIIDRVMKKQMFGAFFGELLAGFIGIHDDGSIGMLTVVEQFRGQSVGAALETFACNQQLEQGMIPYGILQKDDAVSKGLQQRLGLCITKKEVFWVEQKMDE